LAYPLLLDSGREPHSQKSISSGLTNPAFHQEQAMNPTFRTLVVTVVVAALSIAALPARVEAQATGFQDAGAKISGETYWPSRASGRYIESARNYAQEVQTYVAKAPQPEPSVVKDIKTDLGRYLDDAQRHLVAMKKDFANDKETVAAVGGLEKELAMAIAHNKEMITCCEDQKFDKIKTMSCCTDLVKQLDKVHADHVALMRKLSQKYAASPGTTK